MSLLLVFLTYIQGLSGQRLFACRFDGPEVAVCPPVSSSSAKASSAALFHLPLLPPRGLVGAAATPAPPFPSRAPASAHVVLRLVPMDASPAPAPRAGAPVARSLWRRPPRPASYLLHAR